MERSPEKKMKEQPVSTFLFIKFVQYGLVMTPIFILLFHFIEGEAITIKKALYYFIFFSIWGPGFEYYFWKRRFKNNE